MKRIQTDNWLRSVLINYGKKKSGRNLSGMSTDSHCSFLSSFLTTPALAAIIFSLIKKNNTFKRFANQFLFCKHDYRYDYRLSIIAIGCYSKHCYEINPENSFTPYYVFNVFFHNALKFNTNYENSSSKTV
jgi:hypothetical protein